MTIAVVGSNMVDLISYITRMPAEGETVEAPDFKLGCGGKGANQAVVCSRLGSEVVMVTRVGNDIFAQNTIDNFAANGIDTKYVLSTDATSGVAPIFVDPDSKNSIIIVKGANAFLRPEDVDRARDDIATCELIMLQLEIPLDTVYHTINLGNELGIPVLLNPAPASPELRLDRIRGAEFVMPNETELSLLSGMPVEDMQDVEKAAQVLLAAGIRNVIVTLGSKGALWVHNGGTTPVPAHPVDAIDTTGAGDAFIGCFAHQWVTTKDVEYSMKIAKLYAADSVTRHGTQSSYALGEDFQQRFAKDIAEAM